MKKLFISQPMRGLSDEEILKTREEIKKKAEAILGEKVEILPSFFNDFKPVGNIPVAYLGKSISLLAEADVVFFGGDWATARGCKIEYTIADQYDIKILTDKTEKGV